MLRPQEPPGVYWMEGSKRRLAETWLGREDLTAEEHRLLQDFVACYRTDATIPGDERRRLAAGFQRLERRLRRASVTGGGSRQIRRTEPPNRTSPT